MIKSDIIDKINKNMKAGGIYSPRRPITFLKTFYARTRTHLSLSHYSIAMFPFALLAQIINIWQGGNPNFAWTSSFLTICGSVMLVPSILSGLASFSVNFKNQIKGNLNLKLKLVSTPFLVIFAIFASIFSVTPKTVTNSAYTTMLVIICILMFVMEFNGKKLIFKDINRN